MKTLTILLLTFLVASIVPEKAIYAQIKPIGWSDVQVVNAIYLAEGGNYAQYLYGIRSVKCTGYSECRKICLKTVKRNRQRFASCGHKDYPDFIAYLGSRYCPVKGKLSFAESKVNRFWIKNVTYFLNHPRKANL